MTSLDLGTETVRCHGLNFNKIIRKSSKEIKKIGYQNISIRAVPDKKKNLLKKTHQLRAYPTYC